MESITSGKQSVIFFGTPKIAATCLQALLDSKVNVVAVVTKPDRPVGRKHQIIFSEVKQLAIRNNLTLFQPENLNDIYEQIKQLNPDLIFSCAYGKIIPNNILSIPRLKCINVHPSLLPKYRGATPIQSAIINNEKETGVSFMYMVDKLDAGDILFQEVIPIDEKQTACSLFHIIENKCYEMIRKNINDILENKITSTPQNDLEATYCTVISKEDEKIE
ncbi:MAG: methionyl-tRNA formyltransferase [Mycoplasmoidaceae bacterium]|nr:methionyl-tRNA formyltransferase [Mycoplasmoidaceae bacterium]